MSFNIDKFLESSFKRKALSEEDFVNLCEYIMELLLEEPTVISVSTPISVVGDIHGQYYDLLRIFDIGGQVPYTKYIFMGDYVDRGRFSLETLTLLLCLKAKYPDRIVLLRGNHETRQISHSYGFFDDCSKQYGNIFPWTKCMEVFDCLPVAALIDEEILCVHGGLSPEIRTLDQIRLIPRRLEVPPSGSFADLMWSDPEQSVTEWAPSTRGAGWVFGYKPTKEFCQLNQLSLVARAHQLVMEGYKFAYPEEDILVTVWSAPNYSYQCGNIAALMQVHENGHKHFTLFSEVPNTKREIPPPQAVPYFM